MPSASRSEQRLRRGPNAALLAVAAIAAMLAILVGAWSVAPRYIVVQAEPTDSRISMEGGPSGIGRLVVPAEDGRPRRVTVARSGYTTATATVRPSAITGLSDTTVSLAPDLEPLHVMVGPGDPLVSVYNGSQRVLVGVRRVAGHLPSGRYRILATTSTGARAERSVMLDRPTRLVLTADAPTQKATTQGVIEATGRVTRLAFSQDGSLLAATLFDGPPDREFFTVATLRRVPDSAVDSIRMRGFSSGQVATSVVDPQTKVRYGIDTTASTIIAERPRGRARVVAKMASPPVSLGLAEGGRALVVGCLGGRDRSGQPFPGLVVLDPAGKVADRIASPTCAALAIAPDGHTIAIADTTSGRIRVIRLAETGR